VTPRQSQKPFTGILRENWRNSSLHLTHPKASETPILMDNRLSNSSYRKASYLLLCSIGAGALSSFPLFLARPEVGVRNAILAFALSLGLAGINRASRSALANGRPPKASLVFGIGTLSGLAAGTVLAALSYFDFAILQDAEAHIRLPPLIYGWRLIVLCLAYGLVLHFAYALRWKFSRQKVVWTLVCVAAGGYLCGLLQGYFDETVSAGYWLYRTHWPMPTSFKYVSALWSGIPFAFFWASAAIAFDPAWSFERWRKVLVAKT